MASNQLKLSQDLFWDINYNKLDFQKNKRFIISRVLNYGDIDDFKQLMRYYNLQSVKHMARRLRSLDKKSLSFYSLIFNLPKNKFLCFQTALKQRQDIWLNR